MVPPRKRKAGDVAASPKTQASVATVAVSPSSPSPASSSSLAEVAEALAAERRRLPAWEARAAFLRAFGNTDTLVLTGETGCGKTTQIPQFLLAAGYGQQGCVGVTQPRRVAAMSVARRVAAEMGEEVGGRVGYHVRFDERTSAATTLRYMTDGMLLREAVAVPSLRRYSVVVVDEAHERSLQTDMMLALLRRAQAARRKAKQPPLKILVMSATLDTATFCEYFGGAPAVQISGRQFPVAVHYTASAPADYLEAAATAVMQIHLEEACPGDVLCFLPGQDDIDAVAASLRHRWAQLSAADAGGEQQSGTANGHGSPHGAWHTGGTPPPALAIHALYAALPPTLQLRALQPAPAGTRKVILATNIAETSLTIDGVVHVVDTGLAKVRMYHPGRRIDSLLAAPISKAAARQRAGRAGRQQPGQCFRLFTEDTYTTLSERNVPEIQRTSLSAAVLALKALGIDDVLAFEFVSPPSRAGLVAALEQLFSLGALDTRGALTDDGRLMSKLPLEPTHAKALLASARQHDCASQMLTLVAMLSTEGSAFVSPPNQRDKADEARRRFTSPQADTLTLINVLSAFGTRKGTAAKAWAELHFVNRRTVESARQVRTQLVESCTRQGLLADGHAAAEAAAAAEQQQRAAMGLPLVEHETGIRVRRCLTAAFFGNAAQRQPSGEYLALSSREVVAIHPSSALFTRRAACVLFHELLYTARLYMRDLTQIDAEWLLELAPDVYAASETKT